jgi:hypothetical protein
MADADPRLRRYLFGRQRPGTRMEAMSWYRRFLLMIIHVRRLNSRESGLSTLSPGRALNGIYECLS